MLILLPPSEGKTAPARGKPLDSRALRHPSLTVVPAAWSPRSAPAPRPTRRSVLGIGHTQLDLLDRNRALSTAPTARADRIYTGVLYDALGFDSLSPAARRRSAARVAIMSLGLRAGPPDRPDPRLPALGRRRPPGLGSVAGAWRQVLGERGANPLGPGLLVDLRS